MIDSNTLAFPSEDIGETGATLHQLYAGLAMHALLINGGDEERMGVVARRAVKHAHAMTTALQTDPKGEH